MNQLRSMLTVQTSVGGMARYTNDYYHSVEHPSTEVPGNPWIITTLWDAQWHIRKAKTVGDLAPARAILEWVKNHATETGILPEQLHPRTGEHLSVGPLTWSHATYVETILEYLKKEKDLR